MSEVGKSVVRKEAASKVSGQAIYCADRLQPGMLEGCIFTSTKAHARIKKLDISRAVEAAGVVAVATGVDTPVLCGPLLCDRPILARDEVRYFGEPIAIVVAHSKREALLALRLIEAEYEDLPLVASVADALAPDACLLHPHALSYQKTQSDVNPTPATNIASTFLTQKGNMAEGWAMAEHIVERRFSMPSTAHAAMETHCAQAQIGADDAVHILSSTQSPYTVKKMVADTFALDEGKVFVDVSLVGGAFGGKSAVTLELLAYVASRAAGGRRVRIENTREQEMTMTPARLALEARIRLGVTREGKICAMDATYQLDTGAYSDIGPYMSKAIAVDCTGPYAVENLCCESVCVYTNHTYATAYRGFAHESMTFCIERTIDALCVKAGIDAMDFRQINGIMPGDTSPTQVPITRSNAGDIGACITKLRSLCPWDTEKSVNIGAGKVRAIGLGCYWKAPNPPTNAAAGAVITFNEDGSVNLITGIVEIGSGSQSAIAQMVADKLTMPYDRVHVVLHVDTRSMPHYYKTVASMSTYLVGRAAMKACEDVLAQLKHTASMAFRCDVDELVCANEKVHVKHAPAFAIAYKDLAMGYMFEGGNTVGGQVIGRGGVTFERLTPLAQKSGKGKTAPATSVGIQAVEVELDNNTHRYRITRAWTVMDVGCVVDPDAQRGMVRGGMSMGLSLARCEQLHYDALCVPQARNFRRYKVLHIGEEPQYVVEFIETPQIDSPYGNRAFSEHGIIAMPAALANAITIAMGMEVDCLPISEESLWHLSEEQHDS